MCQTNNLKSMMTTVKIMSIIMIVFAFALIVSGAVAASYSVPKWCDEPGVYNEPSYSASQCQEDYDAVDGMLKLIALWGTLPGILPLIWGILGIVASMHPSKGIIGCCLAMAIIGTILCVIGFFVPYVGAAIVTTLCAADEELGLRTTADGRDFCDRYGGGLWAVVVLNVILAIYQFAFAIVLCCICCANESVWSQKNAAVAPIGSEGAPSTSQPAGIPMTVVNTQEPIPVAEPVKMS
mmetsp:Transcript_38712/g.91351  ORF Transcript_38712/g.91351 Transcript_38712/m.91351 type:complete len:238 (-) Transcript_38712:89-802(-)